MAHRIVHRLACLVTLLAVTSAKKDQTRWSRQISTYTADISDWVPLSGPVEREPLLPQIKRQAIAEPRILTEPFPGLSRPTGFGQETFPSRTYFNSPVNRQLYLQSMPAVPSAPQNYLSDQGFGQSIRFGLSQPNLPLNQGFVSPQYSFENIPQLKQQVTRPQQVPQQGQQPQQVLANPIKFESFQKPSVPISSQTKPFNNQVPKIKPDTPKFIDGYRADNASNDFSSFLKKKPQSLQKIKFENSDKAPKIQTVPQNNQKLEREEVQLLYVPLEQLNRGQFNFRSPISSSQLTNTDIYAQGIQRPSALKQSLGNEFQAKQIENYSGQEYFGNYNPPKDMDQTYKFTTVTTPFPTQSPTTPKPKKLKPHQPPLAIFLTQEASKRNQVKVGDVLTSLKSANTIAVLDSVNPLNSPSVFIGPSHLSPPENYVKFELPYLSNIENTDKKLRQLPFFVAPLSYNTPQGFAKIPFPSPHVGSVVINSQIKETPAAPFKPAPTANIMQNSYSPPPSYKQETKPVTQRPQVSFYSTNSPRTNSPINNNYQSNYYSIEPQSVSTIRPTNEPEVSISKAPPNSGYFSSYVENHSNQNNMNYPQESNNPEYVQSYKEPVQRYKEPAITYKIPKTIASTTTVRTTISTTTKSPSTYPSQLLETHNPYSINQAFHFSTPLDYHNYFDENYATPPAAPEFNSIRPSVSYPNPSTSTTVPPNAEEIVTKKNTYQQQSSPNYLQNYSPEIHYKSEVQNSRYPVYNSNDYTTKIELSSENIQPANQVNTDSSPLITSLSSTAYFENHETQPSVSQKSLTDEINKLPVAPDLETPPTKYEYNKYEPNYDTEEYIPTTPATTTTPTSTKKPLRGRGRPRYTTTPRTYSNESSTRFVVTRKPIRERRPLPTKSRYEPNRLTSEKPTRKPIDFNESTTKSSRGRTRGRIHYKPSGNDEVFEKVKSHNSKEADLAYQRDVLHQNYPVTLMERTSTVDIDAITEPTPKLAPATNYLEQVTETFDAENAYTNERATITQHIPDTESKDDIHVPTFTSRTPQSETSYSRNQPTRNNEYSHYQSRSSLAPVDAISSYDETGADREDEIYQTTPVQKIEKEHEVLSYATEPVSSFTEQNVPNFSINTELSTVKQQEVTTTAEVEETNAANQEHEEIETEQNTVQTTPSYNRVRIRPGVIRQHHQSPSTESPKVKQDRRRPVTYRPAFDRRRTTMRIEEIEADLKTKQVHSRTEEDYRHPIYKPEPMTERSVTLTVAQDTTTKRGHFRRRRPTNSYTTSTETSTKNNYEVKNRFRGRRPTEKPTDKPEVQTESTSTVRNTPFTRYSHRPRLSERYNKKPEPEPEETEDQESNFSINRPKYVEPETEQWSSKISTDSFKPYNPNDIIDEQKVETTERKSDTDELDIITAKNNEYDDILISVTPATNSRNTKKIPDIPPTLEALVEQSKVTKSDSNDKMSTFESMLEEVMKNLEEQDENEYTSNVMKHKGGEIGEIPPERIISSGDVNTKSTTPIQHETTTGEPTAEDHGLINEDESDRKGRRRGFWKKVKVRPATTESIEVAESQYYSHTINQLGQTVKLSKSVLDKTEKYEKPKIAVTTYKPSFQFIKDIFTSDDEPLPIIDILPTVDIPKLNKQKQDKEILIEAEARLTSDIKKETQDEKTEVSPGDFDLGTGSPDPSINEAYYTSPTEPTTPSKADITDKSDAFSLMDYLFGVTSDDSEIHTNSKYNETKADIEATTEQLKPKIVTTESTYIPEEITATVNNDNSEIVTELIDVMKTNSTDPKEKNPDSTEISVIKVETSSVSSFMNPANVVSTSMSTEISHETEICFRGKCIKTSKDVL